MPAEHSDFDARLALSAKARPTFLEGGEGLGLVASDANSHIYFFVLMGQTSRTARAARE